jgi:hypothetical protein
MKNQFIPFQQALELKELGFNEPCYGYLQGNKTNLIIDSSGLITNSNFSKMFSEDQFRLVIPTFSQVFRWFREKYDIHSWIVNAEDNHNSFKPFFRGKNIHSQHLIDFYETYEEAELACLNKLIMIVKLQTTKSE